MIYRFTLTHAVEGTKIISEPDGWEKSTLGFERHPEFHSLVEYFKSTFQAYGSNGTEDGGRDWLLNVEKLHGQDAEINILVEIDEDEIGVFETLYTGQIAVGMFVESLDTDHMLQMVFTQTGFWTKFISRYKNKVNIKSTVTESGDAVTAASDITLPLPSQKVIEKYSATPNSNTEFEQNGFTDILGTNSNINNPLYGNIESLNPIISEISQGFNYANGFAWISSQTTYPPFQQIVDLPILDFNFGGVLDVDLKVRSNYILKVFAGSNTGADKRYRVRFVWEHLSASNELKNRNVFGEFFTGSIPVFPSVGEVSTGYVTATYILLGVAVEPGDKIYVYSESQRASAGINAGGADNIEYIKIQPDKDNTFIKFTINSVAPDTTTKAFLTHDVMDAITKRITDNEATLYSDYLGNTFTSRVYGATGCGSLLANAKGLHIRGYDLTAKPFFKSAEEWWQGINPIHNLGLGYEKLAGVDVIRVEPKEYFYDDSDPLVLLSNVYQIKRSYDAEYHFNQVEIGYEKWQSQAATGTGTASGIDDPQTKRTYNSRFRRMGKKITLFSKWVAASLTLETTRRVGILKSANYTYDDETFVIALKSLGGGSFTPELDENFTTLTNLTNKATRYNSRLTPGRNFLRWANYLNGCLQSYIGSFFKFASGEGNFDMTSQMSTSCLGDGVLVNEKGDFAVTNDFLFIPMPYEIQHFLTWDQYKLIRDNKNRCIGISQTEANHKKFFIKTLEYQIGTGLVKLIAWPKEPFDIVVPDFVDDSPTRYYEDFYESQYE
jgi:hypothetical protein